MSDTPTFALPTKQLVPEVHDVFDESLQINNERVARAATRFSTSTCGSPAPSFRQKALNSGELSDINALRVTLAEGSDGSRMRLEIGSSPRPDAAVSGVTFSAVTAATPLAVVRRPGDGVFSGACGNP